MSTIEVLVGNIASGKSTYARKRAEQGAIIIDPDSIATGIHGGNYAGYREELKPLYKSVELSILSHALAMDKDVVIDKMNHTKKARGRWIALARSYGVQIEAVEFLNESPDKHAWRRFDHDSRGLTYAKWFEVAHRVYQEFEKVDDGEGFTSFTIV